MLLVRVSIDLIIETSILTLSLSIVIVVIISIFIIVLSSFRDAILLVHLVKLLNCILIFLQLNREFDRHLAVHRGVFKWHEIIGNRDSFEVHDQCLNADR